MPRLQTLHLTRTLLAVFLAGFIQAQGQTPLRLEKTIPLPAVKGRIDHLAFDAENQRLFVAALGNNTVEVIDAKNGKLVRTITGLSEPQGVLYQPEKNGCGWPTAETAPSESSMRRASRRCGRSHWAMTPTISAETPPRNAST